MEDKNKKTPAENVAFMLDYETGYLQSALDTLALAEELIESLRVSVAEYDRIGANKLGRGVSALYLVERHLSGFLERAKARCEILSSATVPALRGESRARCSESVSDLDTAAAGGLCCRSMRAL
ncbi:MAG: hypothetical protein ACLR8U_15085 [Oscillospiraceae bacterium]